jgi:hypothetical protein
MDFEKKMLKRNSILKVLEAYYSEHMDKEPSDGDIRDLYKKITCMPNEAGEAAVECFNKDKNKENLNI